MTDSGFESPGMTLSPGRRVGAYEVRAHIGRGGMGDVYRAHDVNLNRDVALKIISARSSYDPDRLARFRREARILAALNHRNIGGIYGVEETDDLPVLVLEFVDGITLADRIARGALPTAEALLIAQQIADALEAAHDGAIIHRDLTPHNVLLTLDGTVKVLDFGIARMLRPALEVQTAATTVVHDSVGITSTGIVLGTAAYMSPEQARGEDVEQQSDIWAFGVIVYEMLVGRHPFAGKSFVETLANVLNVEPAFDLIPTSSPSVHRLLRRCLAKEPRNRLHHIADARLEIEDSLRADGPGQETDVFASKEQPPSLVRATIASMFRVGRLAVVVMMVPLLFSGVGYLNSLIFNRALDLRFTEGFADYFVVGYRAMIGPTAFVSTLALVTIIGLAVLALLIRLATVVSPRHPLRQLSHNFMMPIRRTLAATHDRTLARAFSIAAGVAVLIYVAVAWRLLAVVILLVANGPAAGIDTSVLSESSYLVYVSQFGSVLLLGLAVVWMSLFSRLVRRRADPLLIHVFRLRSLAALVALMVILVAPWRLVWDSRREPVSFDGRAAFILHEDSSRALLYRPGNVPFEVSAGDSRLVRPNPTDRQSIFSNSPSHVDSK